MQTKSRFLSLALSTLILGSACVSTSAFAESNDIPSVTVQYADLNLSGAAGAKAMLQRIHQAASAVCGAQPDSKIDQAARLHDQCVNQAIAGAVRQLDIPMVTALSRGHRGAAPTALASTR
jgi:UrcA family protein